MKKNKKGIPLLEVKEFSLEFQYYREHLQFSKWKPIQKLDLSLYPGEIIAVVGASGAGKSLLADAILGILPNHAHANGALYYKGEELTKERQKDLRGKEIALIPQSVNALDPLMKTGKQVQAAVKSGNKNKIQQEIFQKVGLSEKIADQYPFELSGGMKRRVLAATAMVSGAGLIIADEPTPGLDPEALEETVGQMKRLVTPDKGMMLITHDMEVALQIADRIVVFYEGKTVETAEVGDFSGKGENLRHAYTKALWNALPQTTFQAPICNQPVLKRISKIAVDTVTVLPKLEVKGVSYHYPSAPWLFQQVNLTVAPGEIVGVLGNSGSGKSTLAQIIAGYITPNKGNIKIGMKEASTYKLHPVQLIWQHPEKVIHPRWKMQRMLAEAGGLSNDWLDLLGIKGDWLSRWPSELSGGELQRFCLARVIATKSPFLIADEITTMLDAVTQAQIWGIMGTLAKERNTGILAISHDHALLDRVADRVIDFHHLGSSSE